MVSTANKHATKAAYDILNAGGNALDAAIAAQMVLGVVEPQSSGLGGGGFLLYYNAKKQAISAYDGRETAPNAIKADIFLKQDGTAIDFFDAVKGGRAVGTPGLLAALSLAHKEHGALPWAPLFDSAIALAHDGFKISKRLSALLHSTHTAGEMEPLKMLFGVKGNYPKAGKHFKNPALARTLRLIAQERTTPFYHGEIANDIVRTVRNARPFSGSLALSDLQDYRAKKRIALCRPYRGYRICGMPPPTSGGLTILQIMGILESFPLQNFQPDSLEAIHLITEATRLAYADRAKFIADPDFVTVPMTTLLSSHYLAKRASKINAAIVLDSVNAGLPSPFATPVTQTEPPSTTHLSIIDSQGNAVALTSSIEHAFGSGLVTGGFILNNQLTDFSFIPVKNGKKVANRIAAKKRPRSSMSPIFVFDKDASLILTIGSPGGARIIPYVAQSLIAILDWQMDVQSAISLPHYLNIGHGIELEKNSSLLKRKKALEALGHSIKIRDHTSGLHAVYRDKDGKFYGAADPRREGVAKGK